jgi:hypothetical protein
MHLVNLTEKIRMRLKPLCLLNSKYPFTEVNGNKEVLHQKFCKAILPSALADG